jgi:hypothetical protein
LLLLLLLLLLHPHHQALWSSKCPVAPGWACG